MAYCSEVIIPSSLDLNTVVSPTRCHLLLYYAYVRLNMFRAPLCPLSGAHDDSVGYHTGREPDGLCGNRRYRRELLMMGIMVPETC